MDEATNVIERPSTAEAVDGATTGPRRPAPAWRLRYNPALDGIRGMAVVVVLLFHAGYAGVRGGYLSVSTFFTLSGFLITSLLLGERSSRGGIDLLAFWSRRIRRLLPASAATLVAVAVGSRIWSELSHPGVGGDIVAAALQVANWRFLFDDQAYADLFSSPSPVLHFWSLAIEEQFYWVFPVLTVAVLAVTRGSIKAYGAVLAALVAVSAVATALLGLGERTAIYYATYVRMGEILIGALLAVAVALGLTRVRAVTRLALPLGGASLAAMVWCWANLEQETPFVSRGGLLVYSLLSAALVLSVSVPGLMRRVMAFEPLRLLGLVSYGVYLVHWPIFLVLDPQRTGLDRFPLTVLRVGVTLAVATASYFLVEKPIRRGWSAPAVPMPALAGLAVVTVLLVGVTVPAEPGSGASADIEALWADSAKFQDPKAVPADALIGVALGDSTMLETARGLGAWGAQSGEIVLPYTRVTNALGCSVSRGGERRSRGAVGPVPAECAVWADTIAPEVARLRMIYGRVDFAIVQTGPWEVTDRKIPGDDRFRSPGDPVYDRFLHDEFARATDLFLEQGVVVLWLLAPQIDIGRNEVPPPESPYPESDPARMDRVNEIIQDVADERQGAVTIDLPGYLRRQDGGEMDDGLRPDGVHFTLDGAYEVSREFLAAEIRRAVRYEPLPTPRDGTAAPVTSLSP
ncbi:MAG TPA: acyltransferase [Acidimicrobiales bacterium]|nr:acyltransferase [Acidimicrobiales bacterium]